MGHIKKIIKTILTGAVISTAASALLASNAMARDNVRWNVSIGNTGPVAFQSTQIFTHYPNTVIYSKTPQVIYYAPPVAIQYVQIVPQRDIRPQRYNYYQQWNNGWQHNRRGHHHDHHVRNNHTRHDGHQHIKGNGGGKHHGQNIRSNGVIKGQTHHYKPNNVGHYRGNYTRRW